MLYVQESLGPDEELVHIGQFNIMYTIQAVLNVVFAMIGSVLAIFAAILQTLQIARNQMVSESKDPTHNIMGFLSQKIDQIFEYWRKQGMIPPNTDTKLKPPEE